MNGQIGAASKIAMKRGGDVLLANDIDMGLNVARNGADLIMVDVKLDIKHLVNSLENERIHIPVIACGIASDSKAAVHAIKAGAKEYVPLPPDADLIGEILTAVSVEKRSFIYKDSKTAQMIAIADKIAPSEASIMVTGESGTGKEVIARYIHNNSKRAGNRFVAVNCAAIPENLLESELFGHEKGAFTGAVARRIGKFEEANEGTLLLDEISEMDIRMQAKLLRALQEREIDRIGGKKPVKVNVRVIATSNRDMQQAVKDGLFREDLLFRLNVVNLQMPALRERPEDIVPLSEHFIEKYAELNGVDVKPLDDEATTVLKSYSWQGNVRELENTMHRAVLLASGSKIGVDAIMLDGGTSREEENSEGASSMVGRTVESVERDLIIDTLKHCLGNRTHAANILGISIRTLRNKLRKYTDEGVAIPAAGGME
jgi:DNA-binding NtrC family response regulator